MSDARAGEQRLDAFRRRLLAGLASAITDKGLAATTIGDIVERAGVSKRDFYRVYPGKEDAFLDLYKIASARAAATIAGAIEKEGSSTDAVRRAMHAFLALLDGEPALTRAHYMDIYGLGHRGLEARRQVLLDYCTAVWSQLERTRGHATPRPMPVHEMMAAMAAVNELALAAIETGSDRPLTDLADVIARIITPILHQATPTPSR